MMTRLFDAPEAQKNRNKRDLVREIIIVLTVKLVIITAAAIFVFGPHERPKINPANVAAHLIGAVPNASLPVAMSNAAPSLAVHSRSSVP
jgi:hypothetical protein